MKYRILLGAISAFALVLAACAPAATAPATQAPATLEPTTMATEPAATETSAATEVPTATEAPTTTEAPATTEAATTETPGTPGVPVTGEATINVAEVGSYGSALVNGDGMSLYVFSLDTSGTSACKDDCATEWVPVASQGSPSAGDGVDASQLGTITRDDGAMQVTYNGHPLYTFVEDKAAGDANGQSKEDFGGTWTLISPAGEPIP
jgi:predicted lipoprotein with Yx(FWY)xxD motif